MIEFKTYRVRHGEWQTFAINVSARTEYDAINLATQIREEVGQEPFEEIGGGADGWEAEEIESDGNDKASDSSRRVKLITAAAKNLCTAASGLDSAIDGVTDQFDDEIAVLQDAVRKVKLALGETKGGAS